MIKKSFESHTKSKVFPPRYYWPFRKGFILSSVGGLILADDYRFEFSGTYKWTYADIWTYSKEQKAILGEGPSQVYIDVVKAFDGNLETYWYNKKYNTPAYIQVTFKFTGSLCKIRIKKYDKETETEYGAG